ncbi:TonB C-terminal domain-containing protein [Fluviispira multicolorata]|uniref:TonB C-terminal domain-containing protein n=1 Tax=Fluviispira multicolorata TaxID=2654512 RepID=A0A833JCU0_9BACT|nr:TonB C-terminal domain-containing protein [Fluviispira multicolorata]KAB8030918.1 hypothetical protein GCL57_08070 [Fluviispira multicolorata]
MKKNNLLLDHPNRFPEVDEKNMLKYGKAFYDTKTNILFSRTIEDDFTNNIFPGPRFVKTLDLPLQKKIKQPIIDIIGTTAKIPFLSPDQVKILYYPNKSHFIKSIVIHIFFILSYFILSYIFSFQSVPPDIVEVTFGMSENFAQTKQTSQKDDEVGEREATKTIRELPQLTNNITPDTTPVTQQKIEKTTPKISDKSKDLILKEQNKKDINENNEKLKTDLKKPIGPVPDQDKQKVNLEEYLKRKELDSRKEDVRKNVGVRNADDDKPEGSKNNINNLPDSPFSTPSDIPNSPFAAAPSGVINGKISSKSYNSYKAYIARQLKLNWSTTEGSAFTPALRTRVIFTVNSYGYLIGKAKILKTSGNSQFDQLVLNSVESTFPVQEIPPKDIKPPVTLDAGFTPKSVQ